MLDMNKKEGETIEEGEKFLKKYDEIHTKMKKKLGRELEADEYYLALRNTCWD
jgi:hypothetical protein